LSTECGRPRQRFQSKAMLVFTLSLIEEVQAIV
jgi:hypothetical protein